MEAYPNGRVSWLAAMDIQDIGHAIKRQAA